MKRCQQLEGNWWNASVKRFTQHLQTEKYERSANGRVTEKEQQIIQGMDITAQGFTRDAVVVTSLWVSVVKSRRLRMKNKCKSKKTVGCSQEFYFTLLTCNKIKLTIEGNYRRVSIDKRPIRLLFWRKARTQKSEELKVRTTHKEVKRGRRGWRG